MPDSIFVSYSHQDIGLVQPVVRLLRATEDLVFQDLDSIQPGKRWRREIAEALDAAQLFILFWCYHSSRSVEVRKEYELALTTGKDVLPVLLDTTPLPEQLNEFQRGDFRHLLGSAHRSYRRWIILAVMFVVMAGLSFLFILPQTWLPSQTQPPAQTRPPAQIRPPTQRPPGPPPPAARRPPEADTLVFALTLLILFVATVGALVTWRVRKARRRQARAAPADYQQHMAEQIQGELFRRGIGSG
jgi:TIR domain